MSPAMQTFAKKILLAIDGSTYSAWATDLLSELPFAKSPKLTVHEASAPDAPRSGPLRHP